MVEQENRLCRKICKQSSAPVLLLLSTVIPSQYILGIILEQEKGGAKSVADGRALSRSSVHRSKLDLGIRMEWLGIPCYQETSALGLWKENHSSKVYLLKETNPDSMVGKTLKSCVLPILTFPHPGNKRTTANLIIVLLMVGN